jgi:hypothetical protein
MSSAQFYAISKLDKLLLATDRSIFSEGAARAAITFAQKCSSRLCVMSVLAIHAEVTALGTYSETEQTVAKEAAA